MVAIALSALDLCRSGTNDTFIAVNVTKNDAPEVVQQIFNVSSNVTIKRRDADDVGVSFPCPTELFVGQPSSAISSHVDIYLILFVVILLGLALGIAL
jgi:hypothetical protein